MRTLFRVVGKQIADRRELLAGNDDKDGIFANRRPRQISFSIHSILQTYIFVVFVRKLLTTGCIESSSCGVRQIAMLFANRIIRFKVIFPRRKKSCVPIVRASGMSPAALTVVCIASVCTDLEKLEVHKKWVIFSCFIYYFAICNSHFRFIGIFTMFWKIQTIRMCHESWYSIKYLMRGLWVLRHTCVHFAIILYLCF